MQANQRRNNHPWVARFAHLPVVLHLLRSRTWPQGLLQHEEQSGHLRRGIQQSLSEQRLQLSQKPSRRLQGHSQVRLMPASPTMRASTQLLPVALPQMMMAAAALPLPQMMILLLPPGSQATRLLKQRPQRRVRLGDKNL